MGIICGRGSLIGGTVQRKTDVKHEKVQVEGAEKLTPVHTPLFVLPAAM